MRALLGFVRRYAFFIALLALCLGECALLYAMIPKPKSADPVAQTKKNGTSLLAEVPIGDYRVRNHQIPGDDHVIKFSICLTLDEEAKPEIEERFQHHEHRVREAVAIVARRAGPTELAEPTLATFKRRLRVAIVGAMRYPEYGPEFEVVLPDFLMQRG